ncbi:hypothetical protein SD51_08735, partial [Alicyclobacillus tengchongensis]
VDSIVAIYKHVQEYAQSAPLATPRIGFTFILAIITIFLSLYYIIQPPPSIRRRQLWDAPLSIWMKLCVRLKR